MSWDDGTPGPVLPKCHFPRAGRYRHLWRGLSEVDRVVCIFDRDDPEQYILGDAVEVGEFE